MMVNNLNLINNEWSAIKISDDDSHHLLNGVTLYPKRFLKVLKFHDPGFAAVTDKTGAYHIDTTGTAIYPDRYIESFGYYDKHAAVVSATGCFHIDPLGKRVYAVDYKWCGNFQEYYCPVQDKANHLFYHINIEGQRNYKTNYCYVGDYRDGVAVVCADNGLQTHIDYYGNYIHNCWFLAVDVFHKGVARACDKTGWFHINKQGKALYSKRYKNIEPFYNNIAVVETFDNQLIRIELTGKTHTIIRTNVPDLRQELSADLVGFWKTQTIYAAVKLGLPNTLPGTLGEISTRNKLDISTCERLLRALQELGLIQRQLDYWHLTAKGCLLQSADSSAMADAALVWGDSHYKQWQTLTAQLQLQQTDTHQYFEQLSKNTTLLTTYQHALSGYAQSDYQQMVDVVDWQKHHSVIDAGGGMGTLLHLLLGQYTHLQGLLLEKNEVINLIPAEQRLARCRYYPIDLRKEWDCQTDAIIFARVLHDWQDKDVITLLLCAKAALLEGGKIYILEMVLHPDNPNGSLLDLNMLVMTGGKERTLENWQQLITAAGLKIACLDHLSSIVSLITVETHDK